MRLSLLQGKKEGEEEGQREREGKSISRSVTNRVMWRSIWMKTKVVGFPCHRCLGLRLQRLKSKVFYANEQRAHKQIKNIKNYKRKNKNKHVDIEQICIEITKTEIKATTTTTTRMKCKQSANSHAPPAALLPLAISIDTNHFTQAHAGNHFSGS